MRDNLMYWLRSGWRREMWLQAYYWIREIWRLWVPLLAMIIVAYWRHELIEEDDTSKTALVLYKILIVSGGVILAHMLRSQIFYYIKLGQLLRDKEPIRFLGACILIGLFMFAVIYGFTQGL